MSSVENTITGNLMKLFTIPFLIPYEGKAVYLCCANMTHHQSHHCSCMAAERGHAMLWKIEATGRTL